MPGNRMSSTPPPPKPRAGAIVKSIAVDGAALIGAGLLIYGCWLIFPPAAFVVGGLALLAAGINGGAFR
jgi:hypothetical protein